MLLSGIENLVWRQAIEEAVSASMVGNLDRFLKQAIVEGPIYPPRHQWFRALNELPIDNVKVVILGQDPYHGSGQAHGLSFSVPSDQKLPPSLRNIFKELTTDCQVNNKNGDLSAWVKQGVLLLNSTLTVAEAKAGSHQKKGWESITDAVIRIIAEREKPCVFLLWGAFAISKQALITQSHHLVLTAPHPSPLSAHKGWFGCRHFSKSNAFLIENGLHPIDWRTDLVEQGILEF